MNSHSRYLGLASRIEGYRCHMGTAMFDAALKGWSCWDDNQGSVTYLNALATLPIHMDIIAERCFVLTFFSVLSSTTPSHHHLSRACVPIWHLSACIRCSGGTAAYLGDVQCICYTDNVRGIINLGGNKRACLVAESPAWVAPACAASHSYLGCTDP